MAGHSHSHGGVHGHSHGGDYGSLDTNDHSAVTIELQSDTQLTDRKRFRSAQSLPLIHLLHSPSHTLFQSPSYPSPNHSSHTLSQYLSFSSPSCRRDSPSTPLVYCSVCVCCSIEFTLWSSRGMENIGDADVHTPTLDCCA